MYTRSLFPLTVHRGRHNPTRAPWGAFGKWKRALGLAETQRKRATCTLSSLPLRKSGTQNKTKQRHSLPLAHSEKVDDLLRCNKRPEQHTLSIRQALDMSDSFFVGGCPWNAAFFLLSHVRGSAKKGHFGMKHVNKKSTLYLINAHLLRRRVKFPFLKASVPYISKTHAGFASL